MSVWEIVLIGVALSMDASAVTIANCTTYKQSLSKPKEWSMPVAFALFQFIMPVLGFYVGSLFSDYLRGTDYIVSAVFFVLAVKVVVDVLIEKKNENKPNKKPDVKTGNFSFGLLAVQSVATSIDALFIGITLSMSFSAPFLPALIIGGVTFLIVSASLLLGKYLGQLLGKYAQWFGALILFALAVKTLVSAIV